MKDEIAAIKVSVSSADRSVTVVAGPGGAVLDVRLTEQAFASGSPQSVSGTIMSTLRLAVADAARQQAEVVQRYVGDRLNIVDRVMATQQEIFGERIAEGDAERQRLAERTEQASQADPLGQQAAPVPPRPPVPPAPVLTPTPATIPPRQRPAAEPPDDGGFSGLGGRDNW
jgi:hypothetical protein